ncbi:MAG: hypothetical protein HN348_18445 [Proteobacteria bacterium]|nr:hypothetical protein [Pseudomonadota bacterium]
MDSGLSDTSGHDSDTDLDTDSDLDTGSGPFETGETALWDTADTDLLSTVIHIWPENPEIQVGQTWPLSFWTDVENSPSQDVTFWLYQPSGANDMQTRLALTADGELYAPISVPELPWVTVTAQLNADPSIFTSVDVDILWRTGTWDTLATGVPWPASADHVTLDQPEDPTFVFAIINGIPYRSSNGGAVWTEISTGLSGVWLNDIAVSPADPHTLYAPAWPPDIYRSTDDGDTWVSTGLVAAHVATVAPHPADADQVLSAATIDNQGWKSELCSWEVSAGWSCNGQILGYATGLFDIAIDPTDPSRIYVATTTDGVRWSSDGGQSFNASSNYANVDTRAVELHPTNPAIVYACGYNNVFMASLDYGDTWQLRYTGIGDIDCRSIVTGNASTPDDVYIGTQRGYVDYSNNQGSNWVLLGNPLGASVADLAMDYKSSTVYAAASGLAVHRYQAP